ncbi:MAG: hypothetical protein QMC81_07615 [Thermoanaerobacterales bacterium]|nr:hypothetical protein [Bacillota bacterium]MDI6907336.1 hypothetical protein [Thermoanaerobacterales bacterium]
MPWGWRRKATLGSTLGTFLAGAVLENHLNFLNALGSGIGAVIAGLLALAGAVFLVRLVVLRIIAFRRWRAFCQRPQYVAPARRPMEEP